MLGLKFNVEGLYFNTFRKPISTSLILTYSIPPYTTIRGLISNALGFMRDDYSLQEKIKIGIKLISFPEKNVELTKILKLKGDIKKFVRKFSSSPLFKEFLINPSYFIYLVGTNDIIINIYNALNNPFRPLYLGSSDELVDVLVENPCDVLKTKSKSLKGVLGAEHLNLIENHNLECFIEKIPYKFIKISRNKFSLEYKDLLITKLDEVQLKNEIECYKFNNNEFIWMI